MKKKIVKNSIIIALLATFCVAPFASCNQSASLSVGAGLTNAESQSTSGPTSAPKYYQMPNEFRLVAYGTPPTTIVGEEGGSWESEDPYEYNTQENWQIMRDAGFEWAQPIYYETNDEEYIVSLRNADAINKANPDDEPIKVLITNYDYRNPNSLAAITRAGGTYDEAMATIKSRETEIKARYDAFAQYDSFGGIFGADEPSAHMYEAIAAAQDWFEWNYPGYEFYVNLFPEYATPSQLFGKFIDKAGDVNVPGEGYRGLTGYAAYNKYISDFCAIVDPYMVSYDHYCLKTSETMPGFFFNLATGATNAKIVEDRIGYEVPFFVYLQSMGFEGKMKIDNYVRWAWQVYTSMAFGVTGIQAFCYWTLMADADANGAVIEDGIIDRDGNKTVLYDIVQRVNKDISDLEEVYMAYNWEHTGGAYNGTRSAVLGDFLDSGFQVNSYEDIASININSSSAYMREFLIGQFASRADSTKKAYMVTNSSKVNTLGDLTNLGRNPGSISLTFTSDITEVLVYKPGTGGVPERLQLTSNVLTLEIPTGEGFFVVPVTE